MRITIEKQINQETKEFWCFNLFDLQAVFVEWKRYVKHKGKRKWTIEEFWDKYERRSYNMSDEPTLTEEIKKEALDEILKYIKVQTWDEFKTK